MVNERVFKIAETGQIPADDPVSNIMSQVEIKQDDEPGLWGSFKKWAGSKGGRMTLGGLGTALGVGLSGGDFRDALGYGVIGAGNTAKTLYRNEQDAKHWADRAAQRNLYWQNYEADRKLRQTLQDERIKAQKDLAADDYRRSLDAMMQQYTYNQMALDAAETRAENRQNKLWDDLGVAPALRPYLTASMNGIDLGGAMENYNRNILLDPNSSPEARAAAQQYFEAQRQFDAMMRPPLTLAESAGIAKDAGLTLDSGALNEGRAVFADKPTSGDLGLLNAMVNKYGITPREALARLDKMSPEERTAEALRFEQGKSNIADNSYYNRGNFDFGNEQRAADAAATREETKANNDIIRSAMLEVFKNRLPDKEQKKIRAYARFNNISEDEAAALVMDAVIRKQTAEAVAAGKTPQILNAEYLNTNPNLSEEARGVFKNQGTVINLNDKAEEVLVKERAKAQAEREKGAENAALMRPAVEAAINRAETAALNGSGIGPVGGFLAGLGINSAQGAGANYADIESANAQMNALLRQKLQATGLTGSELNSAIEASAYRYTISPLDSEEVILRKLQNFRKDYLGEGTAGAEKQHEYPEGTIAEDDKGNRLVFRGGVWQSM